MYRDVLALLPTELLVRPVIDGSVSLAAANGAHIDAVAVGYERTNMPFVAEGGPAVAFAYEAAHQQAMARAEAALCILRNRGQECRHRIRLPRCE